MPTLQHYKKRRKQFLADIETPVLLMAGNWISRNYPANWSPFRADSTFLFFFGPCEANAAALFDPKDKSVTVFLNERTAEDALWHGAVPSFAEMKKALGVTAIENRANLQAFVKKKCGKRAVRGLAVADPRATAEAKKITGERLDFMSAKAIGHPDLLLSIARLRNIRAGVGLKEPQAGHDIVVGAVRAHGESRCRREAGSCRRCGVAC